MCTRTLLSALFASFLLIVALGKNLLHAEESDPAKPAPDIVTFTTQEDHAQMLKQLGITKLRPGPSGNASAANPANYDEAKANPFPKLPELLTLRNGDKVTTADDWWKKRRGE